MDLRGKSKGRYKGRLVSKGWEDRGQSKARTGHSFRLSINFFIPQSRTHSKIRGLVMQTCASILLPQSCSSGEDGESTHYVSWNRLIINVYAVMSSLKLGMALGQISRESLFSPFWAWEAFCCTYQQYLERSPCDPWGKFLIHLMCFAWELPCAAICLIWVGIPRDVSLPWQTILEPTWAKAQVDFN